MHEEILSIKASFGEALSEPMKGKILDAVRSIRALLIEKEVSDVPE